MRALLVGLALSLAAHTHACPYVANEYEDDCYGTLLGLTDWVHNGVAFSPLHKDEWWWGASEHFHAVSGSTWVRIEVYSSTWSDKEERNWLAKRTAMAWAGLPEVLRVASMPLHIVWQGGMDNPRYFDQHGRPRVNATYHGASRKL